VGRQAGRDRCVDDAAPGLVEPGFPRSGLGAQAGFAEGDSCDPGHACDLVRRLHTGSGLDQAMGRDPDPRLVVGPRDLREDDTGNLEPEEIVELLVVAVMRAGTVQQVDTPQTLYREPANLFVAAFIGSPAMNLVDASVDAEAIEFAGFRIPLPAGNRPEGLSTGP